MTGVGRGIVREAGHPKYGEYVTLQEVELSSDYDSKVFREYTDVDGVVYYPWQLEIVYDFNY